MKICLCITEDWFALSHFKPLMQFLARSFAEVVLVTRCSTNKQLELNALGLRVIDFDYDRFSLGPHRQLLLALRLASIFRREKPDIVHLIAMKPVLTGATAARLSGIQAMVAHVTGLGHLAMSQALSTRVARSISLRTLRLLMRGRRNWLLTENPDDLELLGKFGVKGARSLVLAGAGVDLNAFPVQKASGNSIPVAACVGRMIRQKGFDVAVEAHRILKQRGVRLQLELYGRLEPGKKDGFSIAEIAALTNDPDVVWHGQKDDVSAIWAGADIALVPSRGREGMPKAMLEAAACSRALIVTDIPGPRHFVRHGMDGLIVAEGDPLALADAIEQLVRDPETRVRLGASARKRIEEGYSSERIEKAFALVYENLTAELALVHE